LPNGSEWYDHRTKQKHAGGQYVISPAPLDVMPLFVRAGSIIPMTEPIEYVDQKRPDEIILDIYPSKKTTGYLYEDDGESFDHERGTYSLTHLTWKSGELKVTKKKAGYASAAKKYEVRVLGQKT
jgi:alpha-D-xyloside xylohydrolase